MMRSNLHQLVLLALVACPLSACDDAKDSAAPKKNDASKAAAPEKATGPKSPSADEKPEPAVKEAKAVPVDRDVAAEEEDADLEPEGGSLQKQANVRGLPPEKPWTAAGPFAAAKFKSGDLAVTPKKAGDGELPHEPEKGVDPDEGTMIGHATAVGWSKDGKTFVLCVDVQADAPECTLTSVNGTEESFMDEERMTRELAAAKPTLGPKTWAHGGDVQFSWKTKPDASGRRSLIVSASVGADAKAAKIATMVFEDLSDNASIFPELLSLNADGTLLAILGHGWEGEGSDDFQLRVVGTGWLAAVAYNKAGMALLGSDNKAAADRFIQASVADPTMWKAPFNAACAHAKAGDVRAKSTLTEAVNRGGEKAKAKALKDKDLASIRKDAWFTALVSG